jgi:hypothetical protein
MFSSSVVKAHTKTYFSGEYKLELVDLASLQQGHDELVNDYIETF